MSSESVYGEAATRRRILDAATELEPKHEIHFLFIGEGKKYSLVEQHMKTHQLQNITLLPFQPEEVLPYSIASGDIGIVAYENGSQGCMIPSKTFYCFYTKKILI